MYLGLLPLAQIIEICLAFEAYAPPHVKSLVWPIDLNAAIAALQAHPATIAAAGTALGKPCTSTKTPLMDSLTEAGEPPDQEASDSLPKASVGESSTPNPSEPTTKPAISAGVSCTNTYPQPPYPGHPFTHTQPTGPHVPYYAMPPPPGYPSYAPHLHAQPYSQTHPHQNFENGALSHPQDQPQMAADDLPSYEEMIVEAIKDYGDPEGAPPKDLFAWMASHYPLQTNFRPSASQALQKAFKRGRLEKTSGGKYRLNASWEGGSVSVLFRLTILDCLKIDRLTDLSTYYSSSANTGSDYPNLTKSTTTTWTKSTSRFSFHPHSSS